MSDAAMGFPGRAGRGMVTCLTEVLAGQQGSLDEDLDGLGGHEGMTLALVSIG